jgi:hypothetical protein
VLGEAFLRAEAEVLKDRRGLGLGEVTSGLEPRGTPKPDCEVGRAVRRSDSRRKYRFFKYTFSQCYKDFPRINTGVRAVSER